MPSDSVTSFLDSARDARLLPPDRLAELTRDPGVPTHNLPAFAADLEARGLLTRYQAGLVGGGRTRDLVFAGYPITDVLGPCPGGTAYRALHPILRTQVILRRLRPDWFAPVDAADAFAARARDACPVAHPRLAQLLDAGVERGEPFAAYVPVPGLPLDGLVRDIGTMPGFLAAEFGRQIADALAAAHAKNTIHGDVRPHHVIVGPLVPTGRTRADGAPILRPGPDGAATLQDLGLVPRRPPAAIWATDPETQPGDVAFLPPERGAAGAPTAAGDVYGLGATLYFVLTGRYPHRGATAAALVADAAANDPRPLADLRPDLPGDFVAAVTGLLARDPSARPTAAAAATALAAFATAAAPGEPAPGPSPSASTSDILGEPRPPDLVPLQAVPADGPDVFAAAVEADGPAAPPSDEWAVTAVTGPDGSGAPLFAPPAYAPTGARRKATDPAEEKRKLKLWIYAGLGLWILSIPLWIILLYSTGILGSGGGTAPGPDQPKKGYRK